MLLDNADRQWIDNRDRSQLTCPKRHRAASMHPGDPRFRLSPRQFDAFVSSMNRRSVSRLPRLHWWLVAGCLASAAALACVPRERDDRSKPAARAEVEPPSAPPAAESAEAENEVGAAPPSVEASPVDPLLDAVFSDDFERSGGSADLGPNWRATGPAWRAVWVGAPAFWRAA